MKKLKKPVSILLILTMIVSLFTIIPFEANAEDSIEYIYRWWDADANLVQSETRTISRSDCIRIQDMGSNRLDSDQGERWIVVDSNTTINDRLYINNHTVNLILCDDVTLTLGMGISVGVTDNTSGKLNIFGQKNDTGKLYCHTPLTDDNTERAIIGGDVSQRNSGDINIFGGTLDLNSGDTPQHRYFGACIGGGVNGAAREVCIYGGNLTLHAIMGAGIGGGKNGQASFLDGEDGIKIYGGTIDAYSYGGSGIGSGEEYTGTTDGGIAIYGGEIVANGVNGGAGIGGASGKNGNIAIYGGKIAASGTGGKYTGAGIGSGDKANQGAPIRILGGTVVAMSQSGAGVGAGACGSAGVIEISNANVTGSASAWGAGIGGGKEGSGGEITITNSTVTATSSNYGSAEDFLQAFDKATSKLGMKSNEQAYADAAVGAITLLIDLFDTDYSGAGIGGGHQGSGGTITISGSTVEAKCGNYAAAIGGGENKSFDVITIDHSNVDAKSSEYGAAIGSGDEASNGGGTINILNNSKVKAVGGEDAAGIGTGNECDSPCDAINIVDSNVEAHGGEYAAAIGGGDNVSGGNITIDNSFVYADRDPYYSHEDEHDEQSPLIEHRNTDGAGIGGGESGHGGNIIIRNNSEVEAHGGGLAAGIGGGDHGDGGNITITDSYVRAYGGTDGAGIGGGEDGDGGHIEIYDSNVYAEGCDYGAGIGGGEDASGDYCGIYGKSTVEAVSGGDGNVQSIGHGDCGWYVPKYTGGTLSLGSGLKVKAGSSVYTGDARFKAIRSNKRVIISACEHEHTSYQPVNNQYHAYYCDDCGMRVGGLEEHFCPYGYVCELCGTRKDGFKLRFVERNNDGEVVTETETLTRGYLMPACENVPDHMEFACWVADNGDTYLPGERYQSAVGTTMTAKYYNLIETTYIDENGSEATALAGEITDSPIVLTSGWYVINDNIVATEAIKIKGDVNLIMADGAKLTFQQVADSAFTGVSSDTVFSLYGQTNQSGFINIQSAKAEFANFNQFGARFRLIQANNNALEIGQRYCLTRGSIDVPKLTVPQLKLGGGFAVIEKLEVGEEAEFSWTDYENTRYQFRLTESEDAVFTVSDGLYFKDQNDVVYSGALTADEIELLRSNYPYTILTPKIPHTYGEPEWVWSQDHQDATAVFRCTDPDCDEVQEIRAKVESVDGGKKTEYVASCRFLNREYTDAVDVNNSWEIKTYAVGGGKVTADKTQAEYDETVTLTVTPDEGYVLKSLTVTDAKGKNVALNDRSFQMPMSKAKVTAEFAGYEHIAAKEPYIDEKGEYILGNVEHYADDDGVCYAVNADGSVNANQILTDISVSYFDFELLSDDTYRINYYNGPTEHLTELKLPKTYDGKAVTILGTGGDMLFTAETPAITLTLTENITEIGAYTFSQIWLEKVTGDTSGLKKIGAYAFKAYEGEDYTLDMTLDYPGVISCERSIFTSNKVVVHLKHITEFSNTNTAATSLTYDFTDAHSYGEPVWNWADDFSTAQAAFTCSDSRCDHTESVNAAIEADVNGLLTVYTATVAFEGKTYTDVRANDTSYFKISIGDSEHGTVTADKQFAQKGETVTLTAEADEGYVHEEYIVKDADENEIAVTGNRFTMPMMNVTVTARFKAGREVEYLDENGKVKTAKAIALTGSETALIGGWYYADGSVEMPNALALSGSVRLILCDGAALNSRGDITGSGANLTVYRAPGESEGSFSCSDVDIGNMTVVGSQITVDTVSADTLSVKGGAPDAKCLTVQTALTISGGTVNIHYNNSGAIVCNGDILITGGDVSAKTTTGDAIVSYGDMTILSGTVTTTGKLAGRGDTSALMISGGSVTVNAPSGLENILIGNTVDIRGGNVTVNGGVYVLSDDGFTIGWTHPNDSIYFEWCAESYIAVEDGQSLTDGTNVFSGVYAGGDVVEPLEDVILTPYGATAWQALQFRIDHAENGDTIMLNADVEAAEEDTALIIPAGKEIILDLNGYTLDRNLSAAVEDGRVIVNNGILTIKDSSIAQTGTVTGGYYNGDGGAILNNKTRTLNIDGGRFTGNTGNHGGVVYNMGTMNMTGGSMHGNTANGNGGAIWNGRQGVLNLSGGVITDNTYGESGAVYSRQDGTLNVFGSPIVTENGDRNIYLRQAVINVTGALNADAKLAVTREDITDGFVFTSGLSGNGTAENFVSDDSGYEVRLNHDGEAVFKKPHTVTVNETENGSVESSASTASEGDTVTLTVTPDEGYSVTSVTVNGDEITPKDGVYSFVMPNEDVTVSATFGFADEIGARLFGHSLSLDGDIGVNFYMELSDSIANSDTAYMHFTIPAGDITTQTDVKVADAKKVESGGRTYYVFKCQVAAKEMTSEIKAQIIDGTREGTVYTYSVREYADYLLAHTADNAEYAKAAPLVKAMLNYGAYSQLNFDRNPGTLANSGLTDAEKQLGDISIDIADSVVDTLPEGTTFEGATLSLKSETTLSLFFKSSETLTFSCDGYNVETVQSGGYQIARIRGIKAKHIGDILTLHVNGGTVQYSPLNYCKNVLNSAASTPDEAQAQDGKLVNVVKALYLYWQAADSYFD